MVLEQRMKHLGVETKMDVLRKTAQIIAENFGINVIFQGHQACTDGNTVIVPSLTEDAPDDLVEAVIGYIDHEVGHIRHTDFETPVRHRFEIKKDKRLMLANNAVEDIRQEYAMCQEYRGIGLNLEFTLSWTLRDLHETWTDLHPFNQFMILAMLRAKTLSSDNQVATEIYNKYKGDYQEIIEAFDHELKEWATLSDTEAAYQAGKRLLEFLDDAIKLPPPPDAPKPPMPPKSGNDKGDNNEDKDENKQEGSENGSNNEEGDPSSEQSETGRGDSGEQSSDVPPPEDDNGKSDEKSGSSDDCDDQKQSDGSSGQKQSSSADEGEDESGSDGSSGGSGQEDDQDDDLDGRSGDTDSEGKDDGSEKSSNSPSKEDDGQSDDPNGPGDIDREDATEEGDQDSDGGSSGDSEGNDESGSDDGSEKDAGGESDDAGGISPAGQDGDSKSNNGSSDESQCKNKDPELSEAAVGAIKLMKASGMNEDGDIHNLMQIKFEHASEGLTGYRPYSTKHDRVVRPEGVGTLERYNKSLDDAREYVNTVYSVLTRTLLSESRSRTQYGMQTGKLNTGALSGLRSGNTGVFKRKRKGRQLNTYVEIVVDMSGSMTFGAGKGKKKITLAKETCIILAEALNKVGISFGISGFTAGGLDIGLKRGDGDRFYDKLRDDHISGKLNGFHRIEPIIEYRFKDGDEPLSKVRDQLSIMDQQEYGNNADGESIYNIAKRVMKRKEHRKVIIVLSDGYPACSPGPGLRHNIFSAHMKQVSKQLQMTPGLELIGIGIKSDAVAQYYDNYMVVEKISDLPGVALGKLKNALSSKGARAA